MMTNKLTRAFFGAFLMAAGLMITSLLMTGCKSSTEPTDAQEYDSQAAADVTASALGTESGGAGVSFADAKSLTLDGTIPVSIGDAKSNLPTTRTDSVDADLWHYVTITRGNDWNNYSFSAIIKYTFRFYDAAGVPMPKFIKGTTDKIDMTVTKQRSKDRGERVDVDDSAYGSWVLAGLTAPDPILNGSFSRQGTDVFHTPANGDRTFTHSFSINFDNDTLVVSNDNGGRKYAFLKGNATSTFSATTPKGYTFTRDTKITFNGDGTAVLDITRTSGDGTVDTYTIDVKVGKWKGFGRIK